MVGEAVHGLEAQRAKDRLVSLTQRNYRQLLHGFLLGVAQSRHLQGCIPNFRHLFGQEEILLLGIAPDDDVIVRSALPNSLGLAAEIDEPVQHALRIVLLPKDDAQPNVGRQSPTQIKGGIVQVLAIVPVGGGLVAEYLRQIFANLVLLPFVYETVDRIGLPRLGQIPLQRRLAILQIFGPCGILAGPLLLGLLASREEALRVALRSSVAGSAVPLARRLAFGWHCTLSGCL
mmetsp:Transcript_5580/g.15702  ORF Transcript_5580/g.15702 Transcript_5580/m.15702 type:complete len:232 (-) Transcript_5580:6-701(-)